MYKKGNFKICNSCLYIDSYCWLICIAQTMSLIMILGAGIFWDGKMHSCQTVNSQSAPCQQVTEYVGSGQRSVMSHRSCLLGCHMSNLYPRWDIFAPAGNVWAVISSGGNGPGRNEMLYLQNMVLLIIGSLCFYLLCFVSSATYSKMIFYFAI